MGTDDAPGRQALHAVFLDLRPLGSLVDIAGLLDIDLNSRAKEMKRRHAALRGGLALALFALGCAPSGYEEGEERSGGDTTVFDTSEDAYARPAANLIFEEVGTFQVGNIFNGDNWVVAPSSTSTRDGLGPVYNATRCSACHSRDGRGRPPETRRGDALDAHPSQRARQDAHGGPMPEPTYGGQLQPRAIPGVPPEGPPRALGGGPRHVRRTATPYSLRRRTSRSRRSRSGRCRGHAALGARCRPQYGLGLLEARAGGRSAGERRPGRRGRRRDSGPPEPRVGRRGRAPPRSGASAGRRTCRASGSRPPARSSATSASPRRIFPSRTAPAASTGATRRPTAARPEADDTCSTRWIFYGQTLAVPAAATRGTPTVLRGRALFRAAGCAGCHVPSLTTGEHEVAALANQPIRPYTDLLLHDMGEELADGRPDFEATGSEWRTPPLWGIGLLETVNGNTVSCSTTAAPAASTRRSSGTAARRKPRARPSVTMSAAERAAADPLPGVAVNDVYVSRVSGRHGLHETSPTCPRMLLSITTK